MGSIDAISRDPDGIHGIHVGSMMGFMGSMMGFHGIHRWDPLVYVFTLKNQRKTRGFLYA